MEAQPILAGVTLILILLSVLVYLIVHLQKKQERVSLPHPSRPKRSKRPPSVSKEPLPSELGVRPVEPFRTLARRVETAFSPDYAHQLKMRVLAKHPEFTPEWYEWVLLELKRYFVMTLLLRTVPMFSEEADEIWHEMLMFTREYQEFCRKIARDIIHHSPYPQRVPMPNERAWFDWVYSQLFLFTPYSQRIWNRFFMNPLPSEIVRQLESASEEWLIAERFNGRLAKHDVEVRQAIQTLIASAKEQVMSRPAVATARRGPSGDLSWMGTLLLAGAFMSATEYEHARQAMMGDHQNQSRDRSTSGCASGCSACGVDDSSDDSNGDGADSGCAGGDSSGCGSGCGGGCGGGCGSI